VRTGNPANQLLDRYQFLRLDKKPCLFECLAARRLAQFFTRMDASTRCDPEIIHTRFAMAHERDPVVWRHHDDAGGDAMCNDNHT
jgi:hypothetical protein